MTARKPAPKATAPGTVTVRITEGLLVFHDGQQRGGVLDVDPDTAAAWQRRGWLKPAD